VDSVAAERVLLQKGRISAGGKQFINRTDRNLRVTMDRATSDLVYTTNTTPIVVGMPQCFAFTFNSANAANNLVHIYAGDLMTPLSECAYSATNDGSGSFPSDNSASDPFRVANTPAATTSMVGVQWVCAYIADEWTLDELRDWQYHPRPMLNTRLFLRLARNGRGGVYDESGNNNNGTITGAIPTNDYLPRVRCVA
jgi:hypothetical protein